MRGAASLCPLLGADGVDPSASVGQSSAAVGPVAIDPQQLAHAPSDADVARLGALLQNMGSDLVPESDLKKVVGSTDELASLPPWAHAVLESGCGAVASDHSHKRSNHNGRGHQGDGVRPRKKPRAFEKMEQMRGSTHDDGDMEIEPVVSSQDAEGVGDDEEDRLRSTFTQEQRVAENVGKYSDTLARLVEMVQRRSEEEISGDVEFGKTDIFVPQEVKTLVQSLKVLDKSALITKCDPALLLALVTAMDRQVRTGLALDVLGIIAPDQGDEPSGTDLQLIERVQSSLDVGICELVLMSTPNIDRRILSEDAIDNCAQLLTHAIQRLILPCIDPTHLAANISVQARTASDGTVDSPRTEVASANGTASTRARNGMRPVSAKHKKNVRKAMERLLPLVCEFMEQLARLISTVKLADRWILQFSSLMVKLFTLEFSSYATLLQRSGRLVLRAIFENYEAHRSLVLDEVVLVMLQLPTSKRNLRTVKLAGSTALVQMITTLVVVLVQVSVVTQNTVDPTARSSRHDSALVPDDDVVNGEGEAKASSSNLNLGDDSLKRIDDARTSARMFVVTLIKECMKKNEERDNRVVLENFLEDLLIMFGRPEWASAEILLEVLSTSLAGILHANLNNDVKKLESQYTLTALNLVGRICASIKMNENRIVRDTLDDENSRAVYDEHERYLRDMLENCSEANGSWMIRGEDIDRAVVLKHIVLTYLRNVHDVIFEDSRRMLVAQFILEEAEKGGKVHAAPLWRSYWSVHSSGTSIDYSSKVVVPQHELAVRASMQVAISRDFGRMFDILISHLMALLSRGIPTFRARVMKALSGIVDVDPMLMAEPAVRNAVSQCFLDEATSVRQAAVDLVGKYVTLQPLLLDRYFDMLCERLRDKGISVRKSVCKILRSYLTLPFAALNFESGTSEDELRRRSSCMRHLVQRIGDTTEEEIVKNFIIDTFQEAWFGAEFSSRQLSGINGFEDEPGAAGSQSVAPPGWTVVENTVGSVGDVEVEVSRKKTRVPVSVEFISPEGKVFASAEEAWAAYRTPLLTPASVVKSKNSKHDDTLATVSTIIEVTQGMATMDWFVALLKRLLYDDYPQSSAARRMSRDRSDDVSVARSRSDKIVRCLIECLLSLEEGKELKGVTVSDKETQFLSCLKALSAFSEANPGLLSPHLEVIMVYINGDEKFSKSSEAKIQSLVVSMVSNEIAYAGRVTKRIASRLESDLKNLIFRAPPSVVGSSVKCLASMSSHTKRPPTLLFKLLGEFVKYLHKFRNLQTLANVKADAIASLQRALFAAGQIGGSLDFDNCSFDLPVSTEPPLNQLVKGSIMDSLYQLYAVFLKVPGSPACTAKAVQGLGFLFMLRPRFLMQAQQDGLFDGLLQAQSHEIRLQTLTSLKELLQHEEQRLEKGTSRKKNPSKAKSKKGQVEGDQDGEGSLIGSVMQAQLENIRALTLEKNLRIRSEAVSCIAVLLTQGLINPLRCIPNLVALEADQVVSIRDLAHSQLLALHEKLPTQIHQPAVEGVFLSHTFQVNAFGFSTVYTLDKDKKEYALFGRLYTTCLRPVRTHRNIFLQSLLNQFSDKSSVLAPQNLQSRPMKTIEYLIFLAQFIATLPFDVEDEPLFIIYHINRYVTLKLGPNIQDTKKMFASLGVSALSATQDEADLSGFDISPFLHHDYEEGKLSALVAQCCVVFALDLLLRVKFFLKDTYGLDNEKCQTYQPGSATKATDQSLFISEHSPVRVEVPPADVLKADHPFKLSWNLLLHTCQAASEDQHQLDFEAHDEIGRGKRRKSNRRRKVVNKVTHTEDDDDEHVDGFDG